jgi:hypothetical protein
MKKTALMTLSAMIGTCLIASAQDGPKRGERQRPAGPPPPEVLEKFDKDGDGKLSPEEEKAAREAARERMEQQRKEMLEKFDKDKDGKLSPEERKAAQEHRRAEMLKKFDKNGDGELSDEERAAMPRPQRRPGGPAGRPGREGGKRGPGAPPAPPAPPAEE